MLSELIMCLRVKTVFKLKSFMSYGHFYVQVQIWNFIKITQITLFLELFLLIIVGLDYFNSIRNLL
jgi:hypothetical protein